MSESVVETLREGAVLYIYLNRPQKFNCFNAAMKVALWREMCAARQDKTIRVIVLAGRGRAFCSGQDLEERRVADENARVNLGHSLRTFWNPLVRLMAELPVPIVCAVNGVAAGGGANLALASDIVVAARSAKFIQSFGLIGMIPDIGGTYFLPRLVGAARASGLSMLAQPIGADDAAASGLIWKAVDDDALMDETDKIVKRLLSLSPQGLARTKRALQQSLRHSLREQLHLESVFQEQAGFTQDYQEGIDAFFEHRKSSLSATYQLSLLETTGLYPSHKQTLYSLFQSRVAHCAEEPAIWFEGRAIRWRDLQVLVDKISNTLASRGVAKGDHVAIIAPNSPHYLATILAVAKLGAVVVPINHELKPANLAYILTHSKVVGVLTTAALMKDVAAARGDAEASMWCISLDEPADGAPALDTLLRQHCTKTCLTDRADPGDAALILYTSGTTGRPKGVVYNHQGIILASEAFAVRMALQPAERLLCVLPLFHVNAFFYSFVGALTVGGCTVLGGRFSASRFWDIAVESGATQVNLISSIGMILVARPESEFNSAHSITKVYGAPISKDMAAAFRSRFHIDTLVEGYGTTEAPGVCSNADPGAKACCVGKEAVHPAFEKYGEVRIVDDEGAEVPAGEEGVIWIRSPAMMREYYGEPEKTRKAFVDGWFVTGDIGYRDADGYYYFIRRGSEIVRRRGENISVVEVEGALRAHPGVYDAAVVGVPSPLGEEELCAVVVMKEATDNDPGQLTDWCGTHLAHYKVPRYIVFRDRLPYTPSHRVMRYKLTEESDLLSEAFDKDAGG